MDPREEKLEATWLANRYQVAGLQAQGALCLVYQGQDAVLQRPVAIKAPSAAHAAMYRSALTQTSALSHPAFLALYDVVEQGAALFLVYEFVEGRPLTSYLATGLPLRRALALILQVTRALVYAHAHGVAHGDLTPSAILVDRAAVARVSNVGMAPDDAYFDDVATSAYASGVATDPDTTASHLTEDIERLDTWAAAAILWQLITDSDTEKSFLARVRSYRADTPDQLRDVIERTMRVNHPNAITSADSLEAELAALDDALTVSSAEGEESVPPMLLALRAERERVAATVVGMGGLAGMRWREVGAGSVSPTATTSYGEPSDESLAEDDPYITQPSDKDGHDGGYKARAPRIRLPSRPINATEPRLLGAQYAVALETPVETPFGQAKAYTSLSGWLWALISLAVFALAFLAGFFLAPVMPLPHLP